MEGYSELKSNFKTFVEYPVLTNLDNPPTKGLLESFAGTANPLW